MTESLYIIGNGFDLLHSLPTSYEDFYNYSHAYRTDIECYYSFKSNDKNHWCDFENDLSTFGWEFFLDCFNEIDINSDDFKLSHLYGLEDDIAHESENHISLIRREFCGWINSIDVTSTTKRVALDLNSKFINFNYTSTLEKIYGIKRDNINYIHGNADEYDDLVFGHGVDIDENHQIDIYGDSNRTLFTDAQNSAKHPLHALKKPVNEIILNNEAYFKLLATIKNVIVIGHSINKIDQPYFRCIAQNTPKAKWTVFYYKNEQIPFFLDALHNCGVYKTNIEFRSCDDL